MLYRIPKIFAWLKESSHLSYSCGVYFFKYFRFLCYKLAPQGFPLRKHILSSASCGFPTLHVFIWFHSLHDTIWSPYFAGIQKKENWYLLMIPWDISCECWSSTQSTGVAICFGPHRNSYTRGCIKLWASQQKRLVIYCKFIFILRCSMHM